MARMQALVASDGSLAYLSGRRWSAQRRVRSSGSTDRVARRRSRRRHGQYLHPRVSPDGTRVAVFANNQEQDVVALGSRPYARLNALDASTPVIATVIPVWTPDGRRIIFTSRTRRCPEPVLAGGRWHWRDRAFDRRVPMTQVRRRPYHADGRAADLQRGNSSHRQRRDGISTHWTGRAASRRWCSRRSSSGTERSRPTAAGWSTRRMIPAYSRSTRGPFPRVGTAVTGRCPPTAAARGPSGRAAARSYDLCICRRRCS